MSGASCELGGGGLVKESIVTLTGECGSCCEGRDGESKEGTAEVAGDDTHAFNKISGRLILGALKGTTELLGWHVCRTKLPPKNF